MATPTRMLIKPQFMLGAQMTRVGKQLGHSYFQMSADKFRFETPGAKLIGWDKNPQLRLADLAKQPKLIGPTVRELWHHSSQLTGHGATYFQIMDQDSTAHAYVTLTPHYQLAKAVLPWFQNASNDNAFRMMLAGFPPFGLELPGEQPAPVMFPESSGELFVENQLELEEWPRRLVAYAKERFTQNARIGGNVALGRSGLITLSDYQVFEFVDDQADLLIRYALASTGRFHVFDGRVIWIQVIDRRTGKVMFFGLGGGTHSFTVIDGANPASGGIVFPTMLRTLVEILNQATEKQLTDGLLTGVDAEFSKLSSDLRKARRIMYWLDHLGRAGAGLRTILGQDVVGAPAPDLTDES